MDVPESEASTSAAKAPTVKRATGRAHQGERLMKDDDDEEQFTSIPGCGWERIYQHQPGKPDEYMGAFDEDMALHIASDCLSNLKLIEDKQRKSAKGAAPFGPKKEGDKKAVSSTPKVDSSTKTKSKLKRTVIESRSPSPRPRTPNANRRGDDSEEEKTQDALRHKAKQERRKEKDEKKKAKEDRRREKDERRLENDARKTVPDEKEQVSIKEDNTKSSETTTSEPNPKKVIHMMSNAASENDKPFPLEVLLPKTETQQVLFLKNHPEYDGREIIIAILDTGVDPSLPGLQKTTTGERKIIDCADCSGAGDVETSTVKTAVDDVVEGLTGRQLKIPTTWKNPSGKFHLGIKPIYDLYSNCLRLTIMSERQKAVFDPANAIRQLEKHEKVFSGYSDELEDELVREYYASQIEFLQSMEAADDAGPVADCLVWNDGNEAVYSLRIDEKNGNWLQIVVANDAHGSHVANIAAAHYAEEPRKNGLAPGAKMVSLCIGDNRLDAMGTGTAMTRAFNMCSEYGVHIANMSFGGGSHLPNNGRVTEEVHRVSSKGNVIFMMSVGNEGPALSSVGAPGGTSTGVIGVGAYLIPEMSDPLYGVYNKVEGNLYPWSSRAPMAGWVSSVPSVPRYTRQSSQMMNGTSMSSPNAAGAVACLLSGLKANDQPWSSHQIRLALENTADTIEGLDKFSQGQGMVQIDKAFNYLREAGSEFLPRTLTDFAATIAGSEKRGVYLREHYDVSTKKEFSVNVEPKYLEFSDPRKQIEFERHMRLSCGVPWVSIPQTFTATATARSFYLEVDPTRIKEGRVAYAEVVGIDMAATHLGPLFRFPITVVRPKSVDKSTDFAIQYKYDARSGEPVRQFITAPDQAKIVEVKVTSLTRVPYDQFMFHTIYLDDDTCYRDTESHAYHGSGSTRLPFALSAYRPQEIKPEIKLDALTLPLKSTTQKIEPLGPGDVFLNGIQIHRLLLTYKLNVLETTNLRLELPGYSDNLCESPLDCVLLQIFNATKGFIAGSSHMHTHKLEKGEYIIQAQLRHPDPAVLKNLRDVPLHVITEIASPIVLDAYSSPLGPTTGLASAKKFGKKTANPSVQQSVYFGSVPDDKLPKTVSVASGCFMSGNFTVFADSDLSQVEEAKVTYIVSEYSTRPSKMDEKNEVEVEALVARATLLADAYLAISTLDVPNIFKNGLTGVTDLKKADPLPQKEVTTSDNHTAVSTKTAKEPSSIKSSNGTVDGEKVLLEDVDTVYAQALKLVDDDTKLLLLSAKHAVAHGHYGRALKYLQKSVKESQSAGKDTKLAEQAVIEICDKLDWVHISDQLKNQSLVKHMEKFRPFQGSF